MVDDDPGREAVALLLRTHGFAVAAYNSALGLLADPSVDTYACLILDMHMPAMSGLEALETLRRRHVITPAVLMTGLVELRLMARIAAARALLLQKPVLEQELLGGMRIACSTAQESRGAPGDP